jgi:FkbM family methyltransferase
MQLNIEEFKLLLTNYPFESVIYLFLRVAIKLTGQSRHKFIGIIYGLRDFLIVFNLRKIVLGKRSYSSYKIGNITFFINTSNPINLICANLLHEKDYSHFLLHLTQMIEPKTFIDIGAHIGTYTLRIAKLFPNCQVISFEPFIENYYSLSCSIKLNNLTNVKAYPIALGNYEGYTELFINQKNPGGHSIRKIRPIKGYLMKWSLKVKITKLDSFSPFDEPVLIKVDVEGSEKEVLKGALNTLKTHAVVLAVEVHNPPLGINAGLCNCEICHYIRDQFSYRTLVLEHSSQDHRILAISPRIPPEKEASINRVLSYTIVHK